MNNNDKGTAKSPSPEMPDAKESIRQEKDSNPKKRKTLKSGEDPVSRKERTGDTEGDRKSKKEKDSKGKQVPVKVIKRLYKLPVGVVFTSSKGNEFKVVDIIGAGGFGEVHKVVEARSGVTYALKIEPNRDSGKDSKLKTEVLVFKAIEKQAEVCPERFGHFVKMHDCGMTDTLKFLVMSYCGLNLEEVRTSILQTDFTFETALSISFTALEAINDLHEVGFLHRDLKPTNFVIGRGRLKHNVYLIDFGMAQRFDKRPEKLLPGKFEGTVRYASRSCHTGGLAWPKDDYESWLYLSVELFEKEALPWRRITDKSEVLSSKRAFFRHQYNQCYNKCPKDYAQLVRFVDEMPESKMAPDVGYMIGMLEKIRKRHKVDKSTSLDWEALSDDQLKLKIATAASGSVMMDASSKDLTDGRRKKGSVPRKTASNGRKKNTGSKHIEVSEVKAATLKKDVKSAVSGTRGSTVRKVL